MKLNCTKENLAKGLGIISRAVGSAATLPVLANVLLKTDKNRLRLSATNLEVGVNYWLGAKITSPGAITVPARLLSDFVANLPDGPVSLETDKNNLKVEAPKHRSIFNGIGEEEFPSIPTVKPQASFTLPVDQFKKAASQVVLAASVDDARPVLNGVYLYNEGQSFYMVATDSYRLAEKKLEIKSTPKQPVSVIVPARTIQELLRVLDDSLESIEIALDDNQALFKFGTAEMVSRLIDGQFPNYRELIPKETLSVATIDVGEFARLAKIAGLFAFVNGGGMAIEVDSKHKKLSVKSVASQVGEDTSEAEAQVKGGDAAVTLNSRYLGEALGVLETEKVEFSITGKVNPCLLRPSGKSDYLHLIMPLRS